MSLASHLRPHRTPLLAAAGAAAGSAGYFLAPATPPLWLMAAPLLLGLLAFLRWKPLGAALVALGLFALLAHAQTMRANLPWEALASKAHWMDGLVTAIEPGTTPIRVTVEVASPRFYNVAGQVVEIATLRLGLPRKQAETLAVGQGVAAPVRIYPPEAPAYAGARDYRLFDYLNHSALYGYTQGRAEPSFVTRPPPTFWQRAAARLASWQQHVKAASEPYASGVLTALLVADQRQVPAPLREAYRQAGLSHLLAVSGLQLTLVGVGVFWLLRRLLALWPWLALRFNIKTAAAWAGLAAATIYALLAGAPVSVQRALLMVALLLLAAVLGRLRSLPRAYAVAMLAVLALNPAAVMQAGFQLSFAAVGGLILLGLTHGHPRGWWQKGVWLVRSSVVAAWATAPFLLAQFGQFNLLGVAANLVAIPAMAPVTWAAFGGLVLLPFGLHQPLFWLAGAGASWVNAWATTVSAWPLATLNLPPWMAYPVAILAAIALTLIFSRIRYATSVALVLLAATGLAAVWVFPPQASLLVLDGGNLALWHQEGTYRPLWNDNPRLLSRWQRSTGSTEGAPIPATCDSSGCAYTTPLGIVSNITAPTADDCATATLLLSDGASPCPARTLHTGHFSHARLTSSGITVTIPACGRPWHNAAPSCQRYSHDD